MEISKTLVSIIVPCYKQAHFLDESLQSVFDQSYDCWECIIVNDGSPDDTEQVAVKWSKKDQRFKYVSKENGGLSSARNAGIKKSNGTYILPLDADDVLHKDYLSQLVPVLDSNQDLGIVSCYTYIFKETITNIIDELKPLGSVTKDLLYQNQLIATSLYRKELWEQVGGYDESMKNGFEDWEFWIAITKQNIFYKIVPEFLFFYRKAAQSMLIDTIKSHFEDNKEYIIKKHKEVYIEDFENFTSVMFYQLRTYRNEGSKVKNSLVYKLSKKMASPVAAINKLTKK